LVGGGEVVSKRLMGKAGHTRSFKWSHKDPASVSGAPTLQWVISRQCKVRRLEKKLNPAMPGGSPSILIESSN
jgi:hypothetical protein